MGTQSIILSRFAKVNNNGNYENLAQECESRFGLLIWEHSTQQIAWESVKLFFVYFRRDFLMEYCRLFIFKRLVFHNLNIDLEKFANINFLRHLLPRGFLLFLYEKLLR